MRTVASKQPAGRQGNHMRWGGCARCKSMGCCGSPPGGKLSEHEQGQRYPGEVRGRRRPGPPAARYRLSERTASPATGQALASGKKDSTATCWPMRVSHTRAVPSVAPEMMVWSEPSSRASIDQTQPSWPSKRLMTCGPEVGEQDSQGGNKV